MVKQLKNAKIKQMPIDWTNIQKKFKGLWVALAGNEKTVLASGKTAKEAWSKAQGKGHKKPILSYMPKKLTTYVG